MGEDWTSVSTCVSCSNSPGLEARIACFQDDDSGAQAATAVEEDCAGSWRAQCSAQVTSLVNTTMTEIDSAKENDKKLHYLPASSIIPFSYCDITESWLQPPIFPNRVGNCVGM